MFDRTTLRRSACALSASCLALLFLGVTAPTAAQTVTVQNGATLRVTGGGALDLRGATLDFGSTGETARLEEAGDGRVTGGRLTATRELSSPSDIDVAGLGAVISAGQDLGATTVTRGHAAQTAGSATSISRYYDISPATSGGLNATLAFTYHDAELEGLLEEELELFQSTDEGQTWTGRGHDSRDVGANTVTLGGIEAFSRWTLGSETDPLPVELVSFEAALDGERVRLTWQTASETDNAGFAVERTRTGVEAWEEIAFVEGAGTTTTPQSYRHVDADLPFTAERLRYRLRQVDVEGTFRYSVEVEARLDAPERLGLYAPFPNPTRGRATLRYALPQAEKVQLVVYNALGQQVAFLADERQPGGRKEVTFETHSLPSGLYFIRLTAGTTVRTRKMTVVR